MLDSDEGQGLKAPSVAHASPVLENIAVAAAFLAGAIGFFLVLSQPLTAVAYEDGIEPVLLAGVHW